MESSEQKKIYSDWLKNYEELIFKVVCAYAKNSNDQDDLFQDIALQIWKFVPKFRGDSLEMTWFCRVALL